MMSSIFYGEIKEDRLNTWKENKNPYDILADNNRIERLGGWDFLFIADELFTDCVQVDWGSKAKKPAISTLNMQIYNVGVIISLTKMRSS